MTGGRLKLVQEYVKGEEVSVSHMVMGYLM